jgi:hypothetical protein
MRTCARSGCSSPAVAILTYDREALIAYLSVADDPLARTPGDLCERHAGRLVLPRSWQLDDRRPPRTGADPEPAPGEIATPGEIAAPVEITAADAPTTERPTKRLRAVPSRARRPTAPREPRRKWAEVEPSLFDTPTTDTTARAATATAAAAPAAPEAVAEPHGDPVWMPRFGPDNDLEDEVDASTPLLRRAFGAR